MQLVVEKEFLENFFVMADKEDKYQQDFEKFLERVKGFDLVIDYASDEAFYEGMTENPLLEKLVGGKAPVLECASELNDLIEQDSFYDDSSPFKLFLTTKSDAECEQLSSSYGFVYFNLTNLSETWRRLFYRERNDRKQKVTADSSLPANYRFNSWHKLQAFRHPLHAILIFDKYILTDKSNQKLQNNLFPLLENIIQCRCDRRKLSLTIISEEILSPIKNPSVNKLSEVHALLTRFLDQLIGKDAYELCIVSYDKNVDTLHLHARGIYTNYFHIKSDNSFNYFNEKQRVNVSAEIEFAFALDYPDWLFVSKDLKDIRTYLNKVENRPKSAYLPEEICYYPGKQNRLLL